MGIRGELFSTRVILENRTYFFNVKENRMGDLYLNIVESKNREGSSGFERQSVILFAEDLQDFLRGFDESLRVLEKAVRERKRPGPPKAPRNDGREQGGDRDYGRRDYGKREYGGEGRGRGAYEQGGRDYGRREQSEDRDRGGQGQRDSGRDYGRRDYGGQGHRDHNNDAGRPRRVVVKKNRRDD